MKTLSFLHVREIFEDFPEGERAPFLELATKKSSRRVKEMEATMRGIMRQVVSEPRETHPFYKAAVEVFMLPELSNRINHQDTLRRLKSSLESDDRQAAFSALIEMARRSNILDVAESLGLDLKKRGRNYVCRCLFHKEKTPSFTLYPDQGHYHCYGCGEHGDVLDLYQRIRGVDFKTAVKELAKW